MKKKVYQLLSAAITVLTLGFGNAAFSAEMGGQGLQKSYERQVCETLQDHYTAIFRLWEAGIPEEVTTEIVVQDPFLNTQEQFVLDAGVKVLYNFLGSEITWMDWLTFAEVGCINTFGPFYENPEPLHPYGDFTRRWTNDRQ